MKWLSPSHFPALENSKVHVWKIDLQPSEESFNYLQGFLSTEEHLRAAKLRSVVNKRFIISRGRLRELLGRYRGLDPKKIIINYTQNGKPYLDETLCFNVSHSGDMALLAFAKDHKLGIDIEYQRADIEFKKIAERFFTQCEYKELLHLPEESQLNAFYQCWVKKEAYVKALGLRLYEVLQTVSLDSIISPISLMGRDQNWQIIQLPIQHDYSAALAIEKQLKEINCFNLGSGPAPH